MVGLLVNADIALKIGVRLQRWRLLAMIHYLLNAGKNSTASFRRFNPALIISRAL
jgi:hypothetical protein